MHSETEPLIVGTVFFQHGERSRLAFQREINRILSGEGLAPLGWRKVPTDPSALGRYARDNVPQIHQLLVAKGHRREAQLFAALHKVKIRIEAQLSGFVNVVSLGPNTTVYKALCTASQLGRFYPDLEDPDFSTRLVIGHRRFSTNTLSNWNIVQPFHLIAHNGEINTITANCRAIHDAASAINMGDALMKHGSDSAQLDRVVEMMAAHGINGIGEALRRMIPPSWLEDLDDERERRFFRANRRAFGTIGAWEGPIAVVATDGNQLVAALDRMGLRPLRFLRTSSDRVIVASEMGAIPVPDESFPVEGQLEPGGMLVADLETGDFIPPGESMSWILERTGLNFEHLASVDLRLITTSKVHRKLPVKALNGFGWTQERARHLRQMLRLGKEPIYSMGNDRPLAIFSENNSRLYSFLHQIVAVVTNPPIDPIREGGAMDTTCYLGRSPRMSLSSAYQSWPQYKLSHPILTNEEVDAIIEGSQENLEARRLDATFTDDGRARTLVRRIHELTEEALETVREKATSILVLSDFEATRGKRLPLPMLLVVSAIHQALAAAGMRRDASLVVETGEVHEGHDAAVLLAYGASAVNPYAMLHLAEDRTKGDEDLSEVVTRSIVNTLTKVMSKMGITSFSGYQGSALFEAVGIASDVVEYYIPDTISRVGGITMDDVYGDIVARISLETTLVKNLNVTVFRREVVNALQLVARNGNTQGDYDRFVALLEETPAVYLRDMLEIHPGRRPVPLEDVADVGEIIRSTIHGAAMSHGALHSLAHRSIAAAFNHFGSRSNCGEGGEDERRNPGGEWESDRSRTRQVASGRFGVDARYLVGADEIEIKIGQGAKPGEGGHLPGAKVTEEIARIRKTRAGVDLISPPPHHDIYSIEDLAQLISNIRELHPTGLISVKVPSITGLGTIGLGIVKTGADIIVVSGFEGGTGAASSSSIAHAGLPLERGVSEVHQNLVAGGIRDQVRIRADGGIKSGLDIAKILALGADEVAVGTPLLAAENCVFCRGCSKGACPVGIATHDETRVSLRFMKDRMETDNSSATDRYEEARNGVIRYLECMGEHLRRILARCGLRHPRELVGRVDLLEQVQSDTPRWDRLDLTELLLDFRDNDGPVPGDVGTRTGIPSELNQGIVDAAEAFLSGARQDGNLSLALTNSDHGVGATLAGRIARAREENAGATFEIRATGFAGQGFGFGATRGMVLRLEGYANDTVGEIMGEDAKIVIMPPRGRTTEGRPHLVGNAAAYGATGGTLFVAGRCGQRFGIRNSRATLVCEGVGKYAFEYMTGGTGVVLGSWGPCLGSGMTGGELFLYDPQGENHQRLHADVAASKVEGNLDAERSLNRILTEYHDETGSLLASHLLDHWAEAVQKFLHVLRAD